MVALLISIDFVFSGFPEWTHLRLDAVGDNLIKTLIFVIDDGKSKL
jgi:hypothetical protein